MKQQVKNNDDDESKVSDKKEIKNLQKDEKRVHYDLKINALINEGCPI